MLVKRASLALLATRALFSLASPLDTSIQFTIQEPTSNLSLKPDDTCNDKALIASAEPKDPHVKLDEGTFIGIDANQTHQFLGIPFAYPP